MELNLPIIQQVANCKNLLIAGMGGGFDIFCGLPIYLELQQRGKTVHLANFSFSNIELYRHGTRLSKTLVGVSAIQHQGMTAYFPELYLSQWFARQRNESVTIWCFEKTGARPLLENYRILVEHLHIDGILLIDGGVDSLARGDEAATGTLIEDAISLYAINELTQIPVRLVGCLGMGAEQDVSHAHMLENIARLTADGGFLGSCSLLPQQATYQAYKDSVLFAQNQKYQDPSVINSSVISAVDGHYGNYHLTTKTLGSRLWISPFMALYWFFDLGTLARHNLYLPLLGETMTFLNALNTYILYTQEIKKRPTARVELA